VNNEYEKNKMYILWAFVSYFFTSIQFVILLASTLWTVYTPNMPAFARPCPLKSLMTLSVVFTAGIIYSKIFHIVKIIIYTVRLFRTLSSFFDPCKMIMHVISFAL
jgi:hypothetical protein